MSFFLRELLSFTFHLARSALRPRLLNKLNALYAVFKVLLVGSSGLEPPTSRLSGVRSNQLSYEPSVENTRFELVTSCLQGRRSPN